nr:hypothetical protein [uncultured Roseibium sp.]
MMQLGALIAGQNACLFPSKKPLRAIGYRVRMVAQASREVNATCRNGQPQIAEKPGVIFEKNDPLLPGLPVT